MGTDGRGIDRDPIKVRFSRQRLEQAFQNTHLDPAVIASLDGLVIAIMLRQIAPAPAGAGHPDQRFDKSAVVGTRTPPPFASSWNERLDSRPLFGTQPINIHDQPPKVSLESDLLPVGNPKSLNRHYSLERFIF
ncbi:hypothetical protein Q644_01195 [Brucella intermedia 229E]|uniref:Uncharacterized protein n=1 Tax=Brucella intermedia 229E TaxID=1337887 RepID=U4VGY5_9HYPH|nr:hypothetical protein Q644_01195 [Brucella intermedia 229E]